MPTLAVIAFPGNNCEIETVRAAKRNGFEAEIIRWNQANKVGKFDAYVLPGGFSFEDRGRSGAISAREPIFDALREEAKQGKIILGICNGAQMIVESGLIPVGENPLPFALAHNVRRDASGHVLGTGFYNEWAYLKAEHKNSAFTNGVDGVLHIPFAHGEGRFTSVDVETLSALESGRNVAFRYCDEAGKVSDKFPVTPNGAAHATAAIQNTEGTIMAIMPHPERFFESFDGDRVFISMRQFIEKGEGPKSVEIGDFSTLSAPKILKFSPKENAIYLEKKLIITDNENFSVKSAAESVAGESIELKKSVVFEIEGDISEEKLIESGLFFNANKEFLVEEKSAGTTFLTCPFQNDAADHLAEKLSELFGGEFSVNMYTSWNFGNSADTAVGKVLQNRLLANPNSAEIFRR